MADTGKGGVGNTTNRPGTNQFMRTGHTAGNYGNNPSVTGIGGAGNPKDAIKELKP